jgi:competence protein ComEC
MRGNIVVFVLGVWALQSLPGLPSLAGVVLVPLLALAHWYIGRGTESPWRRGVCRLVVYGAFFAAGFFWVAWLAGSRMEDELPRAWEGRDVILTGIVATLPEKRERAVHFELDVEAVQTEAAVVPRHIALNAFTRGGETGVPDVTVHAGERWRFTVRLRRPHGSANPDGFDFEAWLLERNIRATGYVRPSESNERLDPLVARPAYLLERSRELIRQRFFDVLQNKPYANVLIALAVGDQSGVSQQQWKVFWRTGVGHLISISGLHVTMVAGLAASFAFRLWSLSATLPLRVPARKIAVSAGALAALAYSLIAGFSVPTQRTLYMLSVVAFALWSGRIACASRVLCAALLLVVALDPWAVLNPGFWLSFAAVAVILYVGVNRVGKANWLRAASDTQWAVTVGLVPVLLAWFQQISLISPIANAFAIPVVSLLVVPLTLAGAIPPLDFLLHLAHWVFSYCMDALTWLSELPGVVWESNAPPGWAVGAGMLGVAWIMLPRGFPARWLGAVWLLPVLLIAPEGPGAGALWVRVLDVGQGLAVVVQTERHTLLYDTGPAFSPESDSGNRVIVPYLRAAGISHLDGLIVTHADSDHSGGAISLLDAMPVDWLASSLPDEHRIQAHAGRHLRCFAGQSWQWDQVRFEVLHPAWESYADATQKTNARSCVLKISSVNGSVLLPADIEKASEAELIARSAEQLRADLLIAPHHGSKTSSTTDFLRLVRPDLAVFAVGYRNHFGHPNAEVTQRYRESGAELYRSDRDGAVLIRFDAGKRIAVQAERRQTRRYWRDL